MLCSLCYLVDFGHSMAYSDKVLSMSSRDMPGVLPGSALWYSAHLACDMSRTVPGNGYVRVVCIRLTVADQ